MFKQSVLPQKRLPAVELLIALALILCFVFQFSTPDVVSPDGTLYHGLAENLVDGDGYIDNIRNDFILPPVGHPLVILLAETLGITDPLVFARILLFLGLCFGFLTLKALELPRFYRLIGLLLMYAIIPSEIYNWGVEISLFFSINLLMYCAVRFLQQYTVKAGLVLGLAIAINLLIRPVFGPFLYLTILLAIVVLVKFKRRSIPLFVGLFVGLGIVNGVMVFSKMKFGDKRLSAGTYSEIPLYCANNEHIDLQQIYYSNVWTELSKEAYAEAVTPLKIHTTWEDRADTLKKEVVDFYKNHPGKAMGGIVWRASNYMFNQPKSLGGILFFIWLFLNLFLLYVQGKKLFKATRKNAMFWLSFLLPFYTVAILSLFVYVGERYHLTPNLIFISGIMLSTPMLLRYLDERRKRKATS